METSIQITWQVICKIQKTPRFEPKQSQGLETKQPLGLRCIVLARALYDRTEDALAYVIEFILMISQKTNEKKDYCSLYLVRHGETEWNVKRLIQGHADVPLNKQGELQAKEIAKKFERINFEAIFSSDLIRSRRTAEIIALEKKMAVSTTSALRERYFGRFQGKPVVEYRRKLKKMFEKFEKISDKERHRFKFTKEEESNEELMSRFLTFLREVAVAYLGKNVLIVTHGGPMRILLIHLGFGSHKTLPPYSIGNTAYVKLESDGVDFFIKETFGIKKKILLCASWET